jgi:hypothetical protein
MIRKDDLILVERIDRDYYTDGRGVVERTSYVFGIVASASRDGMAKTWHTIDSRVRTILRERAGQLADLVQDRRVVAELLGGTDAHCPRVKKAVAA